MCDQLYSPSTEKSIHPLDHELGIEWPQIEPQLISDRDLAAPSFKESQEMLSEAFQALAGFK
jgi:dTDP-4-dehydrorhamnose 3,5-epimerase